MMKRSISRVAVSDLEDKQDLWKPEAVYGNILANNMKFRPTSSLISNSRFSTGKKLTAIEQRIIELSQQEEDSLFVFRFNSLAGIMIMLNAFAMGVELESGHQDEGDAANPKKNLVWLLVESLFICFFLVEILMRVWLEKKEWPRSWWNWLDSTVVGCAVLETWILPIFSDVVADISMVTLVRIIRIVRLVRVVRLVRMFRGMYAIVCAFQEGLASIVWVCCIMMGGIFVCAVLTTRMIGRNSQFEDVVIGTDTVADRFGTLPQSVFSLFEFMTLSGWHEVGRPLVVRQPFLVVLIFAYVMVFTYGFLSMVVAIVVEKTINQVKKLKHFDAREATEAILGEILAMKVFFEESDKDHDGFVTKKEFLQAMSTNEVVHQCLDKMGMCVKDPVALWMVLDRSGKGEISIEDLMEGVWKAQNSRDIVWDVVHTNALMLDIQRQVASLHQVQAQTFRKIQSGSDAKQIRARLEKIKERQAQTSESVHQLLKHLKTLQRTHHSERGRDPDRLEHRPSKCCRQVWMEEPDDKVEPLQPTGCAKKRANDKNPFEDTCDDATVGRNVAFESVTSCRLLGAGVARSLARGKL